MLRPRWGYSLVGWLVDLVALGGAWWLTIVSFIELRRGGFLSELGMYFCVVLVPAANALWLQIRVAPRIALLAQKMRREELALTLIRPREYLVPRLRWCFVRALLPMATTLPFQVISLWVDDSGDVEFLLVLATGVAWVAFGMCLGLLGAFDVLVRLCQSSQRSEVAVFLIPIVWAVISVGAPVGLLWLWGIFLFEVVNFASDELTDSLMFGLGLLFFSMTVFFTVKRWRRACALYYFFG